jgi:hypothetical protein
MTMHRALGVPELLQLVLASFSDPKACDLLNCALVSKAWEGVATEVLWRAPQREIPWIRWYEVVEVISEIVKSELEARLHLLSISCYLIGLFAASES